ncbi:hypothetical protein JHK82_027950 [Glycine max]|nr:hypothetical protein JHK82_027950 [Glycine max]KAG5151730.1 hypothetical protein JHK84_028202 [Glycine max]
MEEKCLETGETLAIKKVLQDELICRAIVYIHNCIGVSHRDIKDVVMLGFFLKMNKHQHRKGKIKSSTAGEEATEFMMDMKKA